MSVTKNAKTGKWDVRVQYHGKRLRAGSFTTEKKALAVEASTLERLKKLEKVNLDNLPAKYEPKYVETDKNLIQKLVAAYRKRQAEKALDRETRSQLEQM